MEVVKFKLKELAGEYKRGNAESDLDDVENGDMELEEWNERYLHIYDDDENFIPPKTVEEAGDFIDVIEAEVDAEEALEYMDSLDQFENFLSNNDTAYIELYREIVFPLWFAHWEPRGIVETRNNVEKVAQNLRTISKKPLEKQFMTLNIAKNLSHQTGSMMDYYEEKFDVSAEDLLRLSNTDVTAWNKELKQIGVELTN